MDLSLYVENLQRQLVVAAEAGGEDARALADRLLAPLDAAMRLAVQEALAVAAEEITTELAPGSVELRIRGRELEFVVTPPPVDQPAVDGADGDDGTRAVSPAAADGDDGGMLRINLRMPEHLKSRVEEAAGADGLSVNSWLVRTAAAAVERTGSARRPEQRAPHGANRYTGWAR
jgi:hypothetical protein